MHVQSCLSPFHYFRLKFKMIVLYYNRRRHRWDFYSMMYIRSKFQKSISTRLLILYILYTIYNIHTVTETKKSTRHLNIV